MSEFFFFVSFSFLQNGYMFKGGNSVKLFYLPSEEVYSKRKELLHLGANSFLLELSPMAEN